MNKRHIFITAADAKRLEELLAVAETFNYRERNDLQSLEGELRRAEIVDSRAIPAKVVTMNTRFRLRDLDDKSCMEATLVFPAEADIESGRMSVLSPIGTAVLGYSEGDTITWHVPAGERRIVIEKVLYQPEAAGDYHL
ncbi:MAG TPA: nucleoside diphosphate kinase regulator [Kiritimatiellia bacterium]|nr:nucleoside diphosphate kinase regulator [Kiritimatiellia bacterium]HSA17715.1 nucleoside diphosphate kinase regulator [Kiritimatiellia bacterium]